MNAAGGSGPQQQVLLRQQVELRGGEVGHYVASILTSMMEVCLLSFIMPISTATEVDKASTSSPI